MRLDATLRNPVPVWVVQDGEELFVRSYKGEGEVCYCAVKASGTRCVRADGVEADVEFGNETDPEVSERIDAAYRAKYRAYGAAYIDAMTTPVARGAALKLIPR